MNVLKKNNQGGVKREDEWQDEDRNNQEASEREPDRGEPTR
jgi:hypothetical protein